MLSLKILNWCSRGKYWRGSRMLPRSKLKMALLWSWSTAARSHPKKYFMCYCRSLHLKIRWCPGLAWARVWVLLRLSGWGDTKWSTTRNTWVRYQVQSIPTKCSKFLTTLNIKAWWSRCWRIPILCGSWWTKTLWWEICWKTILVWKWWCKTQRWWRWCSVFVGLCR